MRTTRPALIAAVALGLAAASAPLAPATADPVTAPHRAPVERGGEAGSTGASAGVPGERTLYDRTRHRGLSVRFLTRDRTDRYIVRRGPGEVRIEGAASNTEQNTRIIVVPRRSPAALDVGSCARWTDALGQYAQQGVVLRARRDGGRARTIVVTKNVFFGASWQFNVTTWDTERDPYLVTHGAVQLPVPFLASDQPYARLAPLPWTVCARTEGDLVRVKGWRSTDPEPSWDDPDHTGTVRLPTEWVIRGKAGWFAGHLPAGGALSLDQLRTWRPEAPPGG